MATATRAEKLPLVQRMRSKNNTPSNTSLDPNNPRGSVGVARLLEVYDDYPHVLQLLDEANASAQLAQDEMAEASRQRTAMAQELDKVKDKRVADNKAAKAAKEKALILAQEEKAEAEEAVELRVRGELEPRIEELETQVETLTVDRDRLLSDLAEKRAQMEHWVAQMEQYHIERSEAEAAEKEAAEKRELLAIRLNELDEEMLEGLRLAINSRPASYAESTNSRPISIAGSHVTARSNATTVRSNAPSVRSQANTVRSPAPTIRSQAPTVRSQAPTVRSEAPTARSHVIAPRSVSTAESRVRA